MRIVIIENASRDHASEYNNYGGEGMFSNTVRIGNDLVGEYHGSSSVADLPNYTGEWPYVPQRVKESQAKAWRNQELSDTDEIAKILDWPNRDAYLTYRQELRDWPSTADFPDTKPVSP